MASKVSRLMRERDLKDWVTQVVKRKSYFCFLRTPETAEED